MRVIIYYKILRPLILRNYRLRCDGKIPDQMYWADAVACSWGLFTSWQDI